MRVLLLDTQTGLKTEASDLSSDYWTDGNGACDCNRRLLCNVAPEKPEGICEGCQRFLIVEVLSLDDNDSVCTLAELNRDYPDALKKAHGVI